MDYRDELSLKAYFWAQKRRIKDRKYLYLEAILFIMNKIAWPVPSPSRSFQVLFSSPKNLFSLLCIVIRV